MADLPITILGRPATEQDLHEFVRYKRQRGEPVRVSVGLGGQATGTVFSRPEFERQRAALRENQYFARASEQVDRLERALFKRRGILLPLPVKIKQGSDCVLGLVWPGITIALDGDAFLSIVAKDGQEDVCQGENPEVLDALAAFAARS